MKDTETLPPAHNGVPEIVPVKIASFTMIAGTISPVFNCIAAPKPVNVILASCSADKLCEFPIKIFRVPVAPGVPAQLFIVTVAALHDCPLDALK